MMCLDVSRPDCHTITHTLKCTFIFGLVSVLVDVIQFLLFPVCSLPESSAITFYRD